MTQSILLHDEALAKLSVSEEKAVTDGIIAELVEFLGGICALCNKPYGDGKSWTIHHRKYRCSDCGGELRSRDKVCTHCGGVPEKKFSNFHEKVKHVLTRGKNKGRQIIKTLRHKLEYYTYLRPIVLARPDDFAAMHHYCHVSLKYGTMWGVKSGNRQRYCDLIMEVP